MTRTFARALTVLMAVAMLALAVGCASSEKPSDVYYRRGSIHADSFPETYGGYGGYSRYGRYRGYGRY